MNMTILHLKKLKTVHIKRDGIYKVVFFTFKPSEMGRYQACINIIVGVNK